MKYCREKKHRTESKFLFGLILTLFCLGTIAYLARFQRIGWSLLGFAVICIFWIIPMFYLTFLSAIYAIWMHRKFRITHDGIQVCYWKNSPLTHSWDRVSDVSLCVLHYGRTGPDTVIRCVIGTEYWGPRNGCGQWQNLTYSIKNHNKVLLIDYSDSLLAEIQMVFPLQICDYRNTHKPDRFSISIEFPMDE